MDFDIEQMKGFVDTHIHAAPSLMAREIDAWDMTIEALNAGYRSIVIKDHHIPSASSVQIVNGHMDTEGLSVFGSIALNNSVGGLNPKAVEAALGFGARIVWMPTVSCENHVVKHSGHGLKFPKTKQELRAPERLIISVDNEGSLIPEAFEVLSLIAENDDVVLATGHGDRKEVDAIIKTAHKLGISRIIATHPHYMVDATMDDMKTWISLGAFIEINAVISVPDSKFYCIPVSEVTKIMRELGTENIIISSDYGQKGNGSPVRGLASFLKLLNREGVDPEQIRRMGAENPSRLLNL